MSKRFAVPTSVLAVVLAVLAVLPIASASAAPSPWWQVSTGSRPSNLWLPANNVQELTKGSFMTFVKFEGNKVACMGSPLCKFLGMPDTETAEELQAVLESPSVYGAGNVEVVEEPGSSGHFLITSVGEDAGRAVTPLEAENFNGSGANVKLLQAGGSGRLVVALTNVGDAAVDATGTPLTIEDELPEGVVASGVIGSPSLASTDPVECNLDSQTHITCTFEGTLPRYEAIEVQVFVSLVGEPPEAGSPGEVTISGANAPSTNAKQEIRVSPEPTSFGLESFSSRLEEEGGTPTTQAGAHPFQLVTAVRLKSGQAIGRSNGLKVEQPGLVRNLRFPLPAGLIGNVTAVQQCSMSDFFTRSDVSDAADFCPDASAVGVVAVAGVLPGVQYLRAAYPVFNLVPGKGEPARFGFLVSGYPVLINTAVDPDNQYRILASVKDTTQLVDFLSTTLVLWGTPGDHRHDTARGWGCAYKLAEIGTCQRPSGLGEIPLLRMPVACNGPLGFSTEVEPWNVPAGSFFDTASVEAPGLHGCNQVPFDPSIDTSPTSKLANGASGLDFRIGMPNHGLLNKDAIAEGQPKKIEVTLPEGVTVNPSQAQGLEACTPAQFAQETASSPSGAGCPEASKIGSVQVKTPLLEEEANGAVYVAKPHDNPFDSLLALYVVAKIPERGIIVKQAGKVDLNPSSGQLVATFDDLPQIPFETFKLHFFEGDRAPLAMPEACGSYDVTTKFTPWSAADPNNPQPNEIVIRKSSFTVSQGPNGSACPNGARPFKPGFTAGTENNAAGAYSRFKARLTREDGEQEFGRFSLKLPKGVVGNLFGIPFCPESAIAQARSRTGASGGEEELNSPSCPPASQIGRTLVGAGVGQALTYVSGKLYLAGPYHGAKLTVVAITPVKVGPFDLGNVVIRQGLKVDPNTAEVSTDGSSGDPIPHILQGIVVHARDIRIDVDRKDFILNPTSCERMKAAASVFGSGGATADVAAPFQAADCASLGFKPKLSLRLKGGTRRGAHPSLRAVVRARKGDANIGGAQVTLPHSEFLEQSHIRTICTRVQFAAGDGNGSQCPKGSVYGRARAISPLLDEPLVGPVYLRSSNHALPDLVAALHSKKVDINLDGRIDSVNGGIRNTFEAVPDAPVTKFVLQMQGGKKGLLVNSTNICTGKHRAKANFVGQNGKRRGSKPLLKARCGGKRKRRG